MREVFITAAYDFSQIVDLQCNMTLFELNKVLGLHIIVSLLSCHDNYLETSIDKRDYHNSHELGKNYIWFWNTI